MIKKLLLLTIIFFWLFLNGNVLAEWDSLDKTQKDAKEQLKLAEKNLEFSKNNLEEAKKTWDKWKIEAAQNEYNWALEDVKKAKDDIEEVVDMKIENRIKECKESTNCIDQSSFTLDTGDIFGGISATASATDTRTGTNMLLGTIIEKLMVALGILSVLIMTVWGGYIILYHGQDELLSKGKSIFMSWVVALVVALSSYMIVGLLRFILYNN